MKQFKWTKQKSAKGLAYPNSREGLTITFVPPPHNLIVMFGGISNGRLNDIMVFDINGQIWKNQETKGRQPAPRCYHVSFYDEKTDCIFFYGGQGDKGRSLADFYILNVTNFNWKRLFLLEMPQSRHHHTISDTGNYEREKIIFGGTCQPENLLLNDLWVFNYQQVTFGSTLPEIPGAQCTLKQTKGDIPSGRKGHASVILQNTLYVFGGKTNDPNENTSQVHQLSLDTYIWKKIQTIGKGPSNRAFFSTSLFAQDKIFIFGGIDNLSNKIVNESWVFQLKDFYWSAPFTAGHMPTPRYHHACCLVENSEGQVIVILGGLELTFCAMDFYHFQEVSTAQNIQWEQLKEPTQMEQKTSSVAGSNIIEGERYLQDIEEAMITERKKATELKKELEVVQLEADNLDNYCTKTMAEVQDKHKQSELNCSNKQLTIETMFLMIKQEQIISKEIQVKSLMLEESLQRVHDYMVILDQFYSAIRRNKLDENDPREVKLKKLSDGFFDEYNKSKEGHKDTLFILKNVYEKFNQQTQRVENDLEQKRGVIFESNKEYEALIFDTENDQ